MAGNIMRASLGLSNDIISVYRAETIVLTFSTLSSAADKEFKYASREWQTSIKANVR